jgi:membrane fusion protein (multidrug efflux system)
MKKQIVCLVFVGLISLTNFGCFKPVVPQAKPPMPVTAFQVEPKTIPATFEFVGVAKSSHPVEIRARVEGYLWSIDYLEGSAVKQGDLLFKLDPLPFEASLQEAKASLAREEAVLWRAQRSLDRIAPLFSKNAVSQRDLDDATAGVLTAEANVQVAKANVVQAELNLSYTRITSPIDGLSARAAFREGTLITPGANGLLTLISVIDPIWVLFSISDNEMLKGQGEKAKKELILPEQQEYTVQLELSDGSVFPYTGKVNFASPTLDPETGSLVVRATFPNPQGLILPGQFVRAYVSGAVRPNAIFVPQESVFQGQSGMYVFVLSKDSKVSLRAVVPGEWYKNYWIIKEGLSSGDVVIVQGTNKLVEGSSVHVTSMQTATQVTP